MNVLLSPANKTRTISFLLAVAFLAFFGIVGKIIVSNKPPPQIAEQRENVFSVRATPAQIGATHPSVLLTGEAEARDYAILAAPVDAEILSIAAREGDTFAANQQLIRLDLRDQQLQARAQQTAVETVKLQIATLAKNRTADTLRLAEMQKLLALASRDYARNITLNTKNLVTQTQIESAEQSVRQRRQELIALQNQVDNYALEEQLLQQQLSAAEVALAQAQLIIERGEMRAPFAGKVAKIHTSIGASAVRGTQLLEIYNPNSVRLRTLVPNRYVAALRGAAQSQAILRDNGILLSLANISPRTKAGQGSVEAFFELPPGDWVLGATFEFQLQLPAVTAAVALPFDSIYSESRIYTIDGDNRARGVECERLGVSRQQNDIFALLRCPQITDGDLIIITQLPDLSDGAKVKIINAATP